MSNMSIAVIQLNVLVLWVLYVVSPHIAPLVNNLEPIS